MAPATAATSKLTAARLIIRRLDIDDSPGDRAIFACNHAVHTSQTVAKTIASAAGSRHELLVIGSKSAPHATCMNIAPVVANTAIARCAAAVLGRLGGAIDCGDIMRV